MSPFIVLTLVLLAALHLARERGRLRDGDPLAP